jgi:hypothetical protein
MGMRGSNMGRVDSTVITIGSMTINEIMHNAPADMDTKDWIELYNPQPIDQDISGWVLKDDDNANVFEIPAATIIPAQGFWVLCADSTDFRQFHPQVKNICGDISFGFGSTDQVRLFTSFEVLVDSVAYTSSIPWPGLTDGQGYSLELVNPQGDHGNPENWDRSLIYGGTPGHKNHIVDTISNPEPNLPYDFLLKQN